MKCKNCGMDLEDGAVFCPFCGESQEEAGQNDAVSADAEASKFCANCGTANPLDAAVCMNCGTLFETTGMQSVNADWQTEQDASAGAKAPKKGMLKKLVIGVVCAAAAVLIASLLVVGGSKLFSKEETSTMFAENYLFYVEDGTFSVMDRDKKKPINVAELPKDWDNEQVYWDSLPWRTELSGNRSMPGVDNMHQNLEDELYFLVEGALYCKNLKKPDAEAERIDKEVRHYLVVDQDTVVYRKGDESRLYVSKKGEAEKVDKDVNGMRLSEDKKKIFYNKSNGDGTEDLYCLNLKDLTTERLLKNVDRSSVMEGDNILFLKNDKLSVLKNQTEEEKLASNVTDYRVIRDGNEEQQIVYMVGDGKESLPLYDFVEDDLALSDAKLQEPREEDFTTIEQGEDFWGFKYERENLDYEAWNQAWEEYYQKEDREYYREYLKEESVECEQGTVYLYSVKSGESMELAKGYIRSYGEYLVSYVDPEELPKYKLSKLIENDEEYSLYEKIDTALDESCKYVVYNGNQKAELDVDPEEYTGAVILQEYSLLRLTQRETDADGRIMYTIASLNLSGSKLGSYTVVDTDVCDFFYGSRFDSGNWYYLKDRDDDGTGDLYKAGEKVADNVSYVLAERNGRLLYYGDRDSEHREAELYLDGERIARDAAYAGGYMSYDGGFVYLTEKGTVYYATDWEYEDGVYNFTVNCYDGKESKIIAEDVASFLMLDEKHIFYLTDYSTRRFEGTLMFYNGKKATPIAEDIAAIY